MVVAAGLVATAGCSSSSSSTRACLRSGQEPFVDRGDADGGLVADRQLVVAGGHCAVALGRSIPAFDGVALLVQLRDRTSAGGPRRGPCSAVPEPGRPSPGWCSAILAPPQVGAVAAGPVRLIGQHPVRPGARMPAARPGDPGCARARPGTADCPRAGPPVTTMAGVSAAAHARWTWSARRGTGPGRDHPSSTPPGLGLQVPLSAPGRMLVRPATVESTETSQVISPAASARACSAVTISPGTVPLPAPEQRTPTARPVPRDVPPRFPAAAAPARPIAHRSGQNGRSRVR